MPKTPRKQIAETDLCGPVRDYLTAQGYTVRCEVSDCDIAAAKGDDLIIIELKRALNISLLAQAVDRQKMTASVYVAIPRPSNRARWMRETKGIHKVLRRLELGLILVAVGKSRTPVEIIFHPGPFEHKRRSKARRAILQEIERRSGDYNEGGSTRRKLVTAYRENAIQIASILAERGPLSPRHLRDLGADAKTQSILYRNVYSWFDRVEKGVYALNDRGKDELKLYPVLAEMYRPKD